MSVDVELVEAEKATEALTAVGRPVVAGTAGPELLGGLAELPGIEPPPDLDGAWCARRGFAAKAGQVLVLSEAEGPITVLVGLGSLAGIPPLAGFLGKFFIFVAAYRAGLHGPLLVAIAAAVVSISYYFGWIRSASPAASFRPMSGSAIWARVISTR